MTDAPVPDVTGTAPGAADARRAMLGMRAKARHAAEKRFGWFSLAMVAVAALSCLVLLGSIMIQSRNALTEYRLDLTVQVTPEKADPAGTRDPATIRQEGDFYGLVQDELLRRFPGAEANGTMYDLFEMAAPVAAVPLARQIAADPSVIGKSLPYFSTHHDLVDRQKAARDAKEAARSRTARDAETWKGDIAKETSTLVTN
ncbi:MAG: DUF3333 domain-containing protein [Hyphomonadaceae bacterium]|nr:DUF3333 domain-containing protein [Hyphomonadaceae bacterium]